MTLLILGGTGEARQIADRLSGVDAAISLAGGPRAPRARAVPTGSGGGGGAGGCTDVLRVAQVSAGVGATDPAADRITARTVRICGDLGLPYLQFLRSPWLAEAGDNWTEIAREEDAAKHIAKGATVFLGTGRQTLERFANLEGCDVICRQIDPPTHDFPFAGGRFLVGRPPFSVTDEVALFTKLAVDVLVVKNAGGAASRTKLTAARQLGIPVLMIARPPTGNWAVVNYVEAALAWVAAL